MGWDTYPHMICTQKMINRELDLRYHIVIRLKVLLSEFLSSIKMRLRKPLLFHKLKVAPKGKSYSAMSCFPKGSSGNPFGLIQTKKGRSRLQDCSLHWQMG